MDPLPTVTVAIPTRNRASLLKIAIESTLRQTFTDFELLVLDDASTDNTREVVSTYDDPRIRYIRHDPNIGMAANWNYGYEHGQGDYVAVLHDDDYWAPTFLERAVAVFSRNSDVALVYSAVLPVDLQGRASGHVPLALDHVDRIYRSEEALGRVVKHTEIGWPAIMVQRAAMLQIGGFTEEFPYHKDWAAWIQLAARHPFGYIADVLGFYRIHADQFSVEFNSDGAVSRDRYEMLWATIPRLPLPAANRGALLRLALRSLAETQLVTAWDAARAGHAEVARREARFAFTIDSGILLRSPQLVAAAYLGSLIPTGILNRLDHFRAQARPLFRRN